MCIIIYKQKNYGVPPRDLLKKCWDNNPDGAGFMFNDGKEVHCYKGFMKFDKFYKKLQEIDSKLKLYNKELAIHFRIGTSGGFSEKVTHPFNLCGETDTRLEFDTDKAFMHNGIIKGYGNNDISDTQQYANEIISNIPCIDKADTLLNNLAYANTSRFLTMLADKTMLSGDWKYDAEHKGLAFSNDGYKRTTSWYYTKDKVKYDYQICDNCGALCDSLKKNEWGLYLCDECDKYDWKTYLDGYYDYDYKEEDTQITDIQ